MDWKTILLIAVTLLSQGYATEDLDEVNKQFDLLKANIKEKSKQIDAAQELIDNKAHERISADKKKLDELFSIYYKTTNEVEPESKVRTKCVLEAHTSLWSKKKILVRKHNKCITDIAGRTQRQGRKTVFNYYAMIPSFRYYVIKWKYCKTPECRADIYTRGMDELKSENNKLQISTDDIIDASINIDASYNDCDIDYDALTAELNVIVENTKTCAV